MHLIDTSICVAILRGRSPGIRPRFVAAMATGVAVSAITAAELHFGVAKCANPERNRKGVENLLSAVTVLPFGDLAAQAFGLVRSHLERRGESIGSFDLLIAAHAIAEGAVLVTNNTREFSRVPTLTVIDWS